MPKVSVRRKVAVATWRPSRDGRLFARVEIDATAALAHVARLRSESGVHVTVTHLVGKAVARAVREVPEAHARVVFGQIRPFPSCDIAFAVDLESGADLAPSKVAHCDRKTVVEIARELAAGRQELRGGVEGDFHATNRLLQWIPGWLLRPLLSVASLVNGGLGLRAFGQPGFPLGSAFVSNVGTLGLDEGFIAPVPFARVPIYVLVGAVREAAVVVDGAVVVRPQLVLTATADHRLIDGSHAGRLATSITASLLHPEILDTPVAAST